MKYVIKLPNRNGYLCHQGTNRVVIYDNRNDFSLAMDASCTKGTPLALEGDTIKQVFEYGWYDNKMSEVEEFSNSLSEYKGFTNQREYMEDYV